MEGQSFESQTYQNLDDLAQSLDILQKDAEKSGTYAVSGALIDRHGRVLFKQKNQVIQPLHCGKTFILNPTNHAERQIVSWYWQHKQALNLPDPSQLTIITTLDPCLMCAFCIIRSGFNVGIISLDGHGGVNYAQNNFANFQFAPQFKKALLDTFGYYKVSGSSSRKHYTYHAQKVVFKNCQLRLQVEQKLDEVFRASMQTVRHHKQAIGFPPSKLKNVRNLEPDHKIRTSLREHDKNSLSLTLTQRIASGKGQSHHYEPNEPLIHLLEDLVRSTPHAKNATALIDPYGNLLLSSADRFDISPIHTAIFCLVTAYSQLRFNLLNQWSQQGKVIEQSPTFEYLSSMDYCSFIFLNSLPAKDALSMLNIGIYAVAIKRDTEQSRLIYINNYESGQSVTIEEVMHFLPPAYSAKHKNIRPIQANIRKKY